MECIVSNTDNDSTDNSSMDYNFTFGIEYNSKYANTIDIMHRYVIHFICLFGIVGNFFNLIILSRKSLTTHMERLEKSGHLGLIALALSDFLFCVTMFPHALMDKAYFSSPSIDFWLIYTCYSHALINTFLLASCWLTVVMAVSRYIVICHPMKARQSHGVSASCCVITLVFFVSAVFNIPKYWENIIHVTLCENGNKEYMTYPNEQYKQSSIAVVYKWLYFSLGIVLPFIVLAYCNLFLIKELKKSSKMRKQCSTHKSSSTKVLTLTMVILVLMYIVFVTPAEILLFWQPYVEQQFSNDVISSYGLAVAICNSMQAVNFAINFILYCVINVHFRRVIREMILCKHFMQNNNIEV